MRTVAGAEPGRLRVGYAGPGPGTLNRGAYSLVPALFALPLDLAQAPCGSGDAVAPCARNHFGRRAKPINRPLTTVQGDSKLWPRRHVGKPKGFT